jgi:hypothetical protein
MTSSLQIRATNAATQCEQTRVVSVYALLTSHFFVSISRKRSMSYSSVQTRANLRTILPHGLWHFLQTGLSKSQLKIPSLTMPGHNPYVAYPHHVPPTPERVFFSTYGFSCPYILDRSSAERQCQLPTRQPRCAPQRPRVSIQTIMPDPPHLSPATDPRAVSVFFFLFLPFYSPLTVHRN